MHVCEAANYSIPKFNLSEVNQQDISQHITYFSGDIDKTLVRPSSQLQNWLKELKPHGDISGFGDEFLTVFEVNNDTSQTAWFLYPFGSVLENINITIYHSNRTNFGSNVFTSGLNKTNQHDLHYGAAVHIEKGDSKTIVMKFTSQFFFAPIKIQLQPLDRAIQKFNIENIITVLCLGICLALAIYNVFIFCTVKKYQYLNYAAATLCFAIGWASIFGLLEFVGLGSSAPLLMSSFILGAFFYAFFFIQLLKLSESQAKLATLLKTVAILSLISVPYAASQPAAGLYLASISTSLVLLIGLFAGVRAWRQGSATARYFTLALLAVLLPNISGNFINLGLLPAYNLNIYLFGLMGNSIETLLLAFAIAVKVQEARIKNTALTLDLEKTVNLRTNELIKLNQELAQSNSELIEANLAKERFLASMSHEIRTPLTSIIGYADSILLGDIGKSEQDRVINIIGENANHLLNVINDILDLSKVEANKLEFEFIPTPLFAILAQIESVVAKRARDKGLAFHMDYQFPLPAEILTDPTRLKQILFNLTNNAIKFTELGFVGLSVKTEGEFLTIMVSDSGEGIAAAHIPKLFESFSQADSSINRRKGGTGLGLSISQRLAHGLDGEIKVKSTPRKGTNFSFTFKLQNMKNASWVNSVGEIWLARTELGSEHSKLPDFAGSRILLADDHANNRELICILLKRMNITVVEVENGEQVIETLFYQKFDLILLDIHMPKMDGVHALRRIRGAGNNTPVIALTANSMNHEIQHYLRIGFNGHLAKPISRQKVVSTLSTYLANSGLAHGPAYMQDMLALTRDYQQDLSLQITKIESAWQNKDMFALQNVAHRIRGSAGAFGFDILGAKFTELEFFAQQDDEIAVGFELPIILELTRLCINIPGVDVPQGIANHNNSIQQLLSSLAELIKQSDRYIPEIQTALASGATSSALVKLTDFKAHLIDCALVNLLESVTQLECKIQQNELEPELIKEHFKQLNVQLLELTTQINTYRFTTE
jgi:signal transduction histidine kinase/DNA-binding response OmpR family regulator